MSDFEERFVYINPLYCKHAIIWRRFIDDIFCVWVGPRETLDEFFEYINSIWGELKFTMTADEQRVSYLDTMVIKMEDGTIQTDIYRKSTG